MKDFDLWFFFHLTWVSALALGYMLGCRRRAHKEMAVRPADRVWLQNKMRLGTIHGNKVAYDPQDTRNPL